MATSYLIIKMAESLPPNKTLKAKRDPPAVRVTAAERAKRFKEDLYEDGGLLFCKFCQHSVDFIRIDTIKDHLKSKKHEANRSTALKGKGKKSTSKQVTLSTAIASKNMREEFVLDYIKLCTLADIPLAKTEKIRPFLSKYCKQAGTLPQVATLRSLYIPRLFDNHFSALKKLLKGTHVSILADETTDVRDQSFLNVIASKQGKPFLIGVAKMETCNHSTFSQSIIRSVTDTGIQFDDVVAVVTDSAAYCKKAYNDVLSAVFPNSFHVLCLAHIVNLAADVFQKHKEFTHLCTLVTMIKSSLFKKPGRKSRYLKYLSDFIAAGDVKLPPVPVSTRWNSWFSTVIYHATRVHLYEGFY